jgi:pimeloyl-ACP methyl ester carboxylesterase
MATLPHAHAHNDYLHKRALFDALDHGFCSVEADVFLSNGELLVGHTIFQLQAERTLESLYLKPLRERIKQNGGKVYTKGPGFWLLVDVKTEAKSTYQALDKVLAKYSDILSVVKDGEFQEKAITVVVSGNLANADLAGRAVRYAGIDGRVADLDSGEPTHLIPWISESWPAHFRWRGDGPMPEEERTKLRTFVRKAHQHGRLVRFWATPERAEVWQELRAANVDLINTDKLADLKTFLLQDTPKRGDELGEEGFVDSAGVKIHYVTKGKGPLIILLHGFPDYWYTWREQMPALAKQFQVVAIDLRGYNKSDQPEGTENYTIDKLVGDVDAVRKHFKQEKATVVGHDWGGRIAWSYAMANPEATERLVILNLPHPKGIQRELATNPKQQAASEYARFFQQDDAAKKLTPELLTKWVKDPQDRKKYVEVLGRSSMEGMLNYYKANYPKAPYEDKKTYPLVKCPVLMFHGLDDPYLLPGALNDTWKWAEKDLTLITVPKAGHWVHHDASELVTKRMVSWLTQK